MTAKVTEEPDVKARHAKRVERRAKYLATLTPKQRITWDRHVEYIRWWRREYAKLAASLHKNKTFIRTPAGHNSLAMYKTTLKLIHQQRLRARTMMLARMAVSVDYVMAMEANQ